MKKIRSTKLFEPGAKVVIMGTSEFDREVMIYRDPVSFVSEIANKNKTDQITNQQFMFNVSTLLKESDLSIPHHSEEAFILALIKAGICSTAILN